jgi:hypothetical protein
MLRDVATNSELAELQTKAQVRILFAGVGPGNEITQDEVRQWNEERDRILRANTEDYVAKTADTETP